MANVKRVNALGITKAGTGISDVPDAPTIGTATGGSGAATVTFTAATTGGTGTTFTATSSPGSITGTASSSPITVEGLTNGTAYTFTVTATNSTGTSPASAATASVTPVNRGDMEAIAMVEVGSAGASSIVFSSIPSTYKHLQIRGIGRTNRSANGDYALVRLNSDSSSSNYTSHYLQGNGSTVSVGAYVQSFTGLLWSRWAAASDGANIFGAGILDILDYTNTNKYKTSKNIGALETNSSNSQINFESAVWLSTSAVTGITIIPGAGTSWSQYSSFALYGIRG